MTLRSVLLDLNAASTLPLVGLVWFVQIVHYPLMSRVGRERFGDYEAAHMRRVTWVVAPLMLVELVTTLLLPLFMPTWTLRAAAVLGVVLVSVVWLSTVFLQIPEHGHLEGGFDRAAHRRLVRRNWIRTLAWTLRGALVLWLLGGCG